MVNFDSVLFLQFLLLYCIERVYILELDDAPLQSPEQFSPLPF